MFSFFLSFSYCLVIVVIIIPKVGKCYFLKCYYFFFTVSIFNWFVYRPVDWTEV
nr:MAG TPA: hypothetical protein [Caudoviricetes sp.]